MSNLGEIVTQNQLDAVEQLRKNVEGWKDQNFDHFWNYFRHLDQSNFDIAKATKTVERYLSTRRVLGVDKRTMIPSPSMEEKFPEAFFHPRQYQNDAELSYNKRYSNLFLYIIVFNQHSVYETFANNFRPSDIQRQFFFKHLRFHRMLMDVENDTNARSGVISIVDIKGASFGFQHVELFATLTQGVIEPSSPKSVQAVIILNAPTLIRSMVNLIKPFTAYADKIFLMTPQQMINSPHFQFNPKMIPKLWGGEMVDSKGDPNCSEFISSAIPEPEYQYHFPRDQLTSELADLERNGTTIEIGRNQFRDIHYLLTAEDLKNTSAKIVSKINNDQAEENLNQKADTDVGKTSLQIHFVANNWYTLEVYYHPTLSDDQKQQQSTETTSIDDSPGRTKKKDVTKDFGIGSENLHQNFGQSLPLNVPDLVNIPIDQNRPGRFTIRFGYQSLKVFTKLKVKYTLKLVPSSNANR